MVDASLPQLFLRRLKRFVSACASGRRRQGVIGLTPVIRGYTLGVQDSPKLDLSLPSECECTILSHRQLHHFRLPIAVKPRQLLY